LKVEDEGRTFNWSAIIGFFAVAAISVVSGFLLQPLVSENDEAINTVVTVFSILAGFLVAVITLIGDPSRKGWQELQIKKDEVEAKLRKHRIIFYLYLVTLGLALAMFLVPDNLPQVRIWLERCFVGLAVFVFLISFTLPRSLSALQMDRYKAELDAQLPTTLKPDTEAGEDRE